jgi:primase-polymerase (primpol)-like protein
MGNVQPITPHNTSVLAPAELRELQGWLIWRFEPDAENPNGKPLKVPYYADGGKRHGKQGGIDDRGRMTTFAAARDAAARRGFTGVGLALMPEFPGLSDVNSCRDWSIGIANCANIPRYSLIC